MLVVQSCPTLCDPIDCSPPGSSVHEIFQERILEWAAISFPGHLPNPGIKPGSPALQADSLYTELQGKPVYRVVSVNPKSSIHLSPCFPLWYAYLFSMSVSLFVFYKWIHLYRILDSTYKWCHMVLVFLWLTLLSMTVSRSIHVLKMAFSHSSLRVSSDSDGKESAYNAGDPGLIPGWGWSTGEGNSYALQYLARRIPWTEEPGGLQSMWLQRIGHDWVTNTHTVFLYTQRYI